MSRNRKHEVKKTFNTKAGISTKILNLAVGCSAVHTRVHVRLCLQKMKKICNRLNLDHRPTSGRRITERRANLYLVYL